MVFYVVLEAGWSNVDDLYPRIVTDEEGKVMKFETKEEAERCAKECQLGLVVEVPLRLGEREVK
jgi:hypothetical protein